MSYLVKREDQWHVCTSEELEGFLRDHQIREIDVAWDFTTQKWTTIGATRSASFETIRVHDSCENRKGKLRGRVFISQVRAIARREKWPIQAGLLVAGLVILVCYPKTLWFTRPAPVLFWLETIPAGLVAAILSSVLFALVWSKHENRQILKYRRRYEELKKNEAEAEFARRQRAAGRQYFDGQWLTKSQVERILSVRIGLDSNFQNMSPYEFEEIVARLFRAMGFSCQVTSKSGDYGVDVVAKRGAEVIAIQCKRNSEGNLVGNRTVAMLAGAMQHVRTRATRGIIVTTSGFTRQAAHQAEGCAIELWDRRRLREEIEKRIRAL
jgi:cell division protein FtsL